MKSLTELLVLVLQDVGQKCGVAVSRDVETLRARVEYEGEGFITLTLGEYAKDLDQALASGSPAPRSFPQFAKWGRSGLPAFGSGFLRRVFDKTGKLLARPDVDCIRSLRQICRFGVKVELPCTDARVAATLTAWYECDQTLEEGPEAIKLHHCRDDSEDPEPGPCTGFRPASPILDAYEAVGAEIIRSLRLEDEDGNIPVRCVHGPGATVEGQTQNGKWASWEWYARLEESGFTWLLARLGAEKTLWGDARVERQPLYVDPQDERPAKVVTVPKSLKSPRVICVEPTAMQFAQQGLKRVLVAAIDQGRYTSGRINFRDQGVNQGKALSGSVDGSYATIDLKDASDRVDCGLVARLFKTSPERFWRMLWACRSLQALLPDGRETALRKFAGMGSALCFPVESLVFYTITIAARIKARGLPVTPGTVARLSQGVYVYGDDICCPADETQTICEALEALGLRVNRRKTFGTGQFRESCGVDAFAGQVVTPVYLRRLLPADRADVSGIVGTVSTCNQLWKAGLWRTAFALRKSVELLLGRLPEVPPDSPALGWQFGYGEANLPKRRNRALQRVETRCWVVEAVEREDPLEGEDALAKCFRRIGFSWTCDDTEHLERTAMPYAIALKRRWVQL